MSNENHNRRWYQFSLLSLLIVMLVSCFGFAWIGSRMRQAKENRHRVAAVEETVATIEKLGGTVTSEYKDLRPQTWLETKFDDPGGAHDPVGVVKVTKVRFGHTMGDYLSGVSYHIDATAGLEQLDGLTDLQTLNLAGNEVTDAGLRHVKAMTNLRSLNLGFTKVTDAGLKDIRDLTRLTELVLHDTDITDDGLRYLKGLKVLRELEIQSTKITDAGLEHLKGMTSLKSLALYGTKATDAGIDKLQQALPNCKIFR